MSLDSDLRALVLQSADVVAQIGNRYHVDNIPEEATTYPLVRAVNITDPYLRSHVGTFGGRATFQLDVFDNDQETRDAAADALVAWLDNYKGAMGSYNVTIQVKNKQGGWEPESRLYRRMIEIEVLYFTV